MPKKRQETLLPERKERAALWEAIFAMPPNEQFDAVKKLAKDRQVHPDYKAAARIEAALAEAHLHPDLSESLELQKLVFVFREVIHDFVPGESAWEALEALHALMSRRPGGGARPSVDHAAVRRWHKRLTDEGKHNATSETATRFDISTRQVRNIVGEK